MASCGILAPGLVLQRILSFQSRSDLHSFAASSRCGNQEATNDGLWGPIFSRTFGADAADAVAHRRPQGLPLHWDALFETQQRVRQLWRSDPGGAGARVDWQVKAHPTSGCTSIDVSKRASQCSSRPCGRRQSCLTGGFGGDACIWSLREGAEPVLKQTFVASLEGKTVSSVQLSGDGKRAAAGSYDGTVTMWDAETGKELNRFTVPGSGNGVQPRVLSLLDMSDDCAFSLLVSGGTDGRCSFWDIRSGTRSFVFNLNGPRRECVYSMCRPESSSAAGYRLLAGGNRQIHVLDTRYDDGKPSLPCSTVGTFHDAAVMCLTSRYMRMRSTGTGTRRGTVIASGSKDATVKLWSYNARRGLEQIAHLRPVVRSPGLLRRAAVRAVLLHDGGFVATGCNDGQIRFFAEDRQLAEDEAGAGAGAGAGAWKLVGRRVHHRAQVTGLGPATASPDARELLACSHDGTMSRTTYFLDDDGDDDCDGSSSS